MRRILSISLAASVLALAGAAPALANPPDLQFKAGNGGGPIGGGQRFHGGGGPGFQGGQRFQGGRGGFQGGRGGFRQYGGGYRHHGGYGGAAVGAGIAGLAAGALIGGAIANQQPYYGDQGYGNDPGYAPAPAYYAPDVEAAPADGDQTAYCEQRYRSYDPQSGTYAGYDGLRHPCP